MFIHDSILPKKLNTLLQAVAVTVNIYTELSVVTIYNSRNQGTNEQLLTVVLQKLPKPVILTGDFNSYLEYWGNSSNDK